MTAPARITQADFERAMKSASDIAERKGMKARVIFRLEAREIETIFGESSDVAEPLSVVDREVWSDDDI